MKLFSRLHSKESLYSKAEVRLKDELLSSEVNRQIEVMDLKIKVRQATGEAQHRIDRVANLKKQTLEANKQASTANA